MSKKIQLTIPTPCHENWNNMTPLDKGKFCGSCQKQVIDFSNMSDRQVADFFKRPIQSLSKDGSVCGRFMNDQLDRNIEIPKKRTPWVRYFFQFAIPTFLLSIKSSSAKAQGTVTVKKINKPTRQIVGESILATCNKPLTNDTIVMPEVVVTSMGRSAVKGKVVNNISSLQGKVAGPVIDVVDKPAGIAASRDLSLNSQVITSVLEGKLGGVVIVVGGVGVKRNISKKEKKNIPFLAQIFNDTLLNSFKIFPNPVPSGAALNIEWKQAEDGYYTLQLLSQSGQSVHNGEIWIDSEARLLNLDIPSVAAGNYFLVLINKKTGKKYTEKIIIQ